VESVADTSRNGGSDTVAFNSGFKGNVFHLILSSLIINILALAMPLMMLQTYDRILPNHGYGTLTLLMAGVGCALILEIVLRLARSYLTGWAGAVFEHKTGCRALRHLLQADMQEVEKQGSGAYLQKMASIGRLRGFYSGQALVTLIDLPFVLTFLVLIAYIAGRLVLVPVVLLAAFCMIAWVIGMRLKQEVRDQDFSGKIRYNYLIETLSGIHTIKALGLEKFFQRRSERLQNGMSICHFKVSLSNNVASNLGMLFSRIMTVAVVSFGALQVIEGKMGTGGLAACILLSGRIMQPVQRALGLWTRFQSFFIDKQELSEIFALPTRPSGNGQVIKIRGDLNLDEVSFRYRDQEIDLLREVNLELRAGQSISLSGFPGSGKTTLLYLIAGLLSPTGGRITVDGVAPGRLPPSVLASHVGYLPEKGEVFMGTIRENLTFFGTVPEEDAMMAARKLGIDQTVALLPAGYETVISDRVTDPVPPGIKQRIAVARILANKPRIILFNNADRGLDKNGYNRLFTLLGRLKPRTVLVIISDDHNILRLADREFFLSAGELRETAPADSKKHSVLPFRELRV